MRNWKKLTPTVAMEFAGGEAMLFPESPGTVPSPAGLHQADLRVARLQEPMDKGGTTT